MTGQFSIGKNAFQLQSFSTLIFLLADSQWHCCSCQDCQDCPDCPGLAILWLLLPFLLTVTEMANNRRRHFIMPLLMFRRTNASWGVCALGETEGLQYEALLFQNIQEDNFSGENTGLLASKIVEMRCCFSPSGLKRRKFCSLLRLVVAAFWGE